MASLPLPQPPRPCPPTPGPSSDPQPPALNPPPITRPPRPDDPRARYPEEAPTYPPTNDNILDALKYSKDVHSMCRPILSLLLANLWCIDDEDGIEAAKYEHAILTQAVAASQLEGDTSHSWL